MAKPIEMPCSEGSLVRIPYSRHITRPEVRAVSPCPPERRLRFFGCTSHAMLPMKTITVQLLLRFASVRQTGNDLQEYPATRLRAIESDLRPLKIGSSYARKKTASREHWRSIMQDTAQYTLKKSMPRRKRESLVWAQLTMY